MYLFVGLGNPGPKYSLTRHNIGFLLIDAFAQSFEVNFKSEHNAETARIRHSVKGESIDILLAKPQTYMNLSGESVQPLMSFYKIPPSKLVVAHDEVDIPYGQLKLQKSRGAGENNRHIHGCGKSALPHDESGQLRGGILRACSG